MLFSKMDHRISQIENLKGFFTEDSKENLEDTNEDSKEPLKLDENKEDSKAKTETDKEAKAEPMEVSQ